MNTQDLKYGDKIVVRICHSEWRDRIFIGFDPVDPTIVIYSNGVKRGAVYYAHITSVKKQKDFKERLVWINVYPNLRDDCIHPTKEIADALAAEERLACVKVSYEYEV